jgi:hypothetical protein
LVPANDPDLLIFTLIFGFDFEFWLGGLDPTFGFDIWAWRVSPAADPLIDYPVTMCF